MNLAPGTYNTTFAEFERITRSYDAVYLSCDARQPGWVIFTVTLEHRHFRPGTPTADLFQMTLYEYPPGNQMLWNTVAIPFKYMGRAREIAWNHDLRFIQRGTPTMVMVGGPPGPKVEVRTFPPETLWRDRYYLVENRTNSAVYALSQRYLAFLAGEDPDGRRAYEAYLSDESVRARQIIARSKAGEEV